MAGPDRPMEGSPQRRLSPSRHQRGLPPPLRVQSRAAEQGDCKGMLSVLSTMETLELAKNSNSVPGGLDFLSLAFAHLALALRHRWQSAGQLHALIGEVVPARLPHGPFARLRAHALSGLAAALNRSMASRLGGNGGNRARTSLGFFPRRQVRAFGRFVAALGRIKASLLGRRDCRRKEVIRPGEVRLRWVAAVQFRMPL
jgi:hypothetical protein